MGYENKMDGDNKQNLGITIAVVAGILGLVGTVGTLQTIAETEGNVVKVACVKAGKSLVSGQCVPSDQIALITANH